MTIDTKRIFKEMDEITKGKCKLCGKTFQRRHKVEQYCSAACRKEKQRLVNLKKSKERSKQLIKKRENDPEWQAHCAHCGKFFLKRVKRQRFCCKECKNAERYVYYEKQREEREERRGEALMADGSIDPYYLSRHYDGGMR